MKEKNFWLGGLAILVLLGSAAYSVSFSKKSEPAQSPFTTGEEVTLKHVKYNDDNHYSVEHVSQDGLVIWYTIEPSRVQYVKGLQTSYFRRVADEPTTWGPNEVRYDLYLKDTQSIDGGDVKTGKSSTTPSVMLEGNE